MSSKQELLISLLREVNKGITKNIRQILVKHNLPPITVIIISQLKENQGITISELARQTGMAKSHIANSIEELARQGMVEKRIDPADQRIYRLYFTKTAPARFDLISSDISCMLSELISGIPESKTAQIINGLQEILLCLEKPGTKL